MTLFFVLGSGFLVEQDNVESGGVQRAIGLDLRHDGCRSLGTDLEMDRFGQFQWRHTETHHAGRNGPCAGLCQAVQALLLLLAPAWRTHAAS